MMNATFGIDYFAPLGLWSVLIPNSSEIETYKAPPALYSGEILNR